GTTYELRGDGCCGVAGTFTLSWTTAPPPANDDFAEATPISGDTGAATGSGLGATPEGGEPGNAQHSVWYAWTPASTGTGVVSVDGGMIVAVYTGSSLASLTTTADSAFEGALLPIVGGSTYFVQVGSYGEGGAFTLT